ncbi:hypothetical protein SDC9_60136 [bioreactor metagenome]|uniref:Uncharacterized protein n=1 Tax=bioreactor metagenome TaxID=1076179 RepID=A0A644XD03_9ZZZZ
MKLTAIIRRSKELIKAKMGFYLALFALLFALLANTAISHRFFWSNERLTAYLEDYMAKAYEPYGSGANDTEVIDIQRAGDYISVLLHNPVTGYAPILVRRQALYPYYRVVQRPGMFPSPGGGLVHYTYSPDGLPVRIRGLTRFVVSIPLSLFDISVPPSLFSFSGEKGVEVVCYLNCFTEAMGTPPLTGRHKVTVSEYNPHLEFPDMKALFTVDLEYGQFYHALTLVSYYDETSRYYTVTVEGQEKGRIFAQG